MANQVDGKPIIRGLFDSEEDQRVEAVKIEEVWEKIKETDAAAVAEMEEPKAEAPRKRKKWFW